MARAGASLIGKKKRDEWMEWWSSEDASWMRRWQRGTPVAELGLNGATSHLIYDADLITLEEVAQRPRREVAAINGIGRVSLRKLDAALAEHGLSWAEVA